MVAMSVPVTDGAGFLEGKAKPTEAGFYREQAETMRGLDGKHNGKTRKVKENTLYYYIYVCYIWKM